MNNAKYLSSKNESPFTNNFCFCEGLSIKKGNP